MRKKVTMTDTYKGKVKAKLYKNYFTKMHESEKHLTFTATRILNDDIIKIFKKHYKKNILDAGCGDGLFIESATRAGLKCEGMDTNNDLLSVCRKKGFTVVYGDLTKKLPYKDGTFDGIYCSNVFEHLHEPEFAMHELLRILKKGGLLIVTVPEAHNRLFYNDWTHVKGFTRMTFNSMMRCFDATSYHTYRRHFPVLVKYWNNPAIRFLNILIKKGPLAWLFTFIFERVTYILRHDLVIEIIK
jgi:ubiquinone/menaquinone biosynthesis C-methylase UbiE